MNKYKTKLTGQVVHNKLTGDIYLEYYYNDRKITQEESIRLKRQLHKVKKELSEKTKGVTEIVALNLYSNEVVK